MNYTASVKMDTDAHRKVIRMAAKYTRKKGVIVTVDEDQGMCHVSIVSEQSRPVSRDELIHTRTALRTSYLRLYARLADALYWTPKHPPTDAFIDAARQEVAELTSQLRDVTLLLNRLSVTAKPTERK